MEETLQEKTGFEKEISWQKGNTEGKTGSRKGFPGKKKNAKERLARSSHQFLLEKNLKFTKFYLNFKSILKFR